VPARIERHSIATMSFPGEGRTLGTGSSAFGKRPFVKEEKIKTGGGSPANPIVINLDEDEDDHVVIRAARPSACDGDAELARRLQAEEVGSSDSSDDLVLGAPSFGQVPNAGWPDKVEYFELQHKPKACSNFDVCSKGRSFFICRTQFYGQPYTDTTAHALPPRPLPGQTLTIHYLPHTGLGSAECALGLRATSQRLTEGGQRKFWSNDGAVTTVVARTPTFTPFSVPSFKGRVERIRFPNGESAFVLRNFDGSGSGRNIADKLAGAFGLDVLDPPSGKGKMAKCAAAQGNNCQGRTRSSSLSECSWNTPPGCWTRSSRPSCPRSTPASRPTSASWTPTEARRRGARLPRRRSYASSAALPAAPTCGAARCPRRRPLHALL
jgi:hypothetical protein